MTIMEQMRDKRLPAYYPTMYQDGYKPWEVLQAAHDSIAERYYEEREMEIPTNIKFKVEVKTK